jgi:DNA-binding Lrp family transcriptional regulator
MFYYTTKIRRKLLSIVINMDEKGYKIDAKDFEILEVLKEHGEYATRQIAKKTGLPPTTVHNRISRLKAEKVIKKFTVELDGKKLGKGLEAYILISASLQVLKEKRKTQYDLANELRSFGFVEKADIVSGGADIVAKVNVSGIEEFDKILLGKIQALEGIEKTQSLIVINSK